MVGCRSPGDSVKNYQNCQGNEENEEAGGPGGGTRGFHSEREFQIFGGIDETIHNDRAAEGEDAALLGDQRAELQRRKVLNTDQARFEENYLGTQSSLSRNRSGEY